MEFRDLKQTKDAQTGSPVFTTQVFIEGIEGCKGTGYSKKESHQQASKETLQRLRREPQFIDAIFASKADRTKMEEEPVMAAPDIDKLQKEHENFIIEQETASTGLQPKKDWSGQNKPAADTPQKAKAADFDEELTLDDITATPQEKTREEIIAEAEAAAFAEGV
jgi:ribonuclease-3